MPHETAYLETIRKIEPDIAMIDAGAFYASAAVSLKRIADALEKITPALPHAAGVVSGD